MCLTNNITTPFSVDLMFFATDIANFLACQHIATLNREREEGKISRKVFADPGAELLRKLGLEHEQKYLNELKARGLKVVEISTDVPWSQAARATREAMVQGADVIYQATLVQRESPSEEGGRDACGPSESSMCRESSMWGGRADFLIRV